MNNDNNNLFVDMVVSAGEGFITMLEKLGFKQSEAEQIAEKLKQDGMFDGSKIRGVGLDENGEVIVYPDTGVQNDNGEYVVRISNDALESFKQALVDENGRPKIDPANISDDVKATIGAAVGGLNTGTTPVIDPSFIDPTNSTHTTHDSTDGTIGVIPEVKSTSVGWGQAEPVDTNTTQQSTVGWGQAEPVDTNTTQQPKEPTNQASAPQDPPGEAWLNNELSYSSDPQFGPRGDTTSTNQSTEIPAPVLDPADEIYRSTGQVKNMTKILLSETPVGTSNEAVKEILDAQTINDENSWLNKPDISLDEWNGLSDAQKATRLAVRQTGYAVGGGINEAYDSASQKLQDSPNNADLLGQAGVRDVIQDGALIGGTAMQAAQNIIDFGGSNDGANGGTGQGMSVGNSYQQGIDNLAATNFDETNDWSVPDMNNDGQVTVVDYSQAAEAYDNIGQAAGDAAAEVANNLFDSDPNQADLQWMSEPNGQSFGSADAAAEWTAPDPAPQSTTMGWSQAEPMPEASTYDYQQQLEQVKISTMQQAQAQGVHSLPLANPDGTYSGLYITQDGNTFTPTPAPDGTVLEQKSWEEQQAIKQEQLQQAYQAAGYVDLGYDAGGDPNNSVYAYTTDPNLAADPTVSSYNTDTVRPDGGLGAL